MEENNVHIISWPKEQDLDINHKVKDPIPMRFVDWPKDALHVNMNMLLNEKGVIPLCIKLCEPICAQSSYKIGINLLGQPFAEISVNGLTRLFNCDDKSTRDDVIR